jgi:ATP synthase protein I
MPHKDESHDEALSRLGARLDAIETHRANPSGPAAARNMGQAYRFLSEVVGGVLGGVGLGWLLDYFAHTAPLGVIGGLLIGSGVSIFAAVRGAAKRAKQDSEEVGPLPSVPDDDDND